VFDGMPEKNKVLPVADIFNLQKMKIRYVTKKIQTSKTDVILKVGYVFFFQYIQNII
jgi:hypothetical protein